MRGYTLKSLYAMITVEQKRKPLAAAVQRVFARLTKTGNRAELWNAVGLLALEHIESLGRLRGWNMADMSPSVVLSSTVGVREFTRTEPLTNPWDTVWPVVPDGQQVKPLREFTRADCRARGEWYIKQASGYSRQGKLWLGLSISMKHGLLGTQSSAHVTNLLNRIWGSKTFKQPTTRKKVA